MDFIIFQKKVINIFIISPSFYMNIVSLQQVDDDSFVNPKRLWSALDHALLHTTTRKSLQPFVRGKKGKQGLISL